MDLLADLGITRILTSGQAPDVSDAADTVREMIAYAGDRIQILPGAGITLRNLRRVAEETGAHQLHVAVHRSAADLSTVNNRSIYYGGCLYPPEDRFRIIDGTAIAKSVPVTAERWQNASSGANPGMAGQDILFV